MTQLMSVLSVLYIQITLQGPVSLVILYTYTSMYACTPIKSQGPVSAESQLMIMRLLLRILMYMLMHLLILNLYYKRQKNK